MKKIIVFSMLLLLVSCKSVVTNEVKQMSMEKSTVKLVAVGDNLIHHTVYEAAYRNGMYDFKPMFEDIKSYIRQFDIAFINQETILGGKDIGLSTYPRFNSPFELGDALIDANFNLISIANNHTLDRGEEAIMNAIQYWEDQNVVFSGANKNESESRIKVFEVNNIQFGFVAYTTSTNGIIIPEDKDYLVNFYNRSLVKMDIEKVRNEVDVIIVSMHWGDEYVNLPTNFQREEAKYLSDLGVDIILGHHPHVIQPIELINDTYVIYSLGNFLSDQKGIDRLIGMAFSMTISKYSIANHVVIELEHPSAKLVYRHKKNKDFKVLLFDDLNDQILKDYQLYYEDKKKLIKTFYDEIRI